MRALTSLGNTAFLGLLGAGAFFGYYTVKYDTDTLQTVVQETHKEENQFVGSSVRPFSHRLQARMTQGVVVESNSSSTAYVQVWLPVMEWYLDQRVYLQSEIKKYQDPPSESLLPPLPAGAA